MRALVLGAAGAVCSQTTMDLAHFSQFEEIVVADAKLESLEQLLAGIGDPRLKALPFSADDYERMPELFHQFDIVINGLPFKYDLAVNKACVESGVNGLDLSSDDPQFERHEQALASNVLFVPGCGATPGITSMLVRKASEALDRLLEVEISFAAFRCLAPAPGLLKTTLWEFDPQVEHRKKVYYRDGQWHPSAPLTGEIKTRFHDQIGEQSVFYVPHDEVDTLPRSYPQLRYVAVRGCFPPHVMELMTALMHGGLLSSQPVVINGKELPAIDAVAELLLQLPISKQNKVWAYGLVVKVLGERDGRLMKCTYRSQHPPQEQWGGEAAYFKNVGIPLSIGAQLIASGQGTAKGVLPPELALPVNPFFEALALRGITIEEQVEELLEGASK